ncbi:septum formation initiator family protein [Paenibacillus sp. GD4]|uniref:FtsB family cell division protein n=1 Tax=Paenibacillus TaxID=44249 RepID=UPI0025429639|nr:MULTISPECIES: septum formation initiator family protein [Paenibacillus]MDQ1910936.1 septum formation initiator family protein [Paenibacillus sp. GD4]
MQATSKSIQADMQSKGSGRRKRILLIGLACFFSWAGITLWNQHGKIGERSMKVSALDQKLSEVQKVNSDLNRDIQRLNDREYLEQIIQRDMNYVKENQILFHQVKPQKK